MASSDHLATLLGGIGHYDQAAALYAELGGDSSASSPSGSSPSGSSPSGSSTPSTSSSPSISNLPSPTSAGSKTQRTLSSLLSKVREKRRKLCGGEVAAQPAPPRPTAPAPPEKQAPKGITQKRRKALELNMKERWYCSYGCGKFYRKTSSRSIKRHKKRCSLLQQMVSYWSQIQQPSAAMNIAPVLGAVRSGARQGGSRQSKPTRITFGSNPRSPTWARGVGQSMQRLIAARAHPASQEPKPRFVPAALRARLTADYLASLLLPGSSPASMASLASRPSLSMQNVRAGAGAGGISGAAYRSDGAAHRLDGALQYARNMRKVTTEFSSRGLGQQVKLSPLSVPRRREEALAAASDSSCGSDFAYPRGEGDTPMRQEEDTRLFRAASFGAESLGSPDKGAHHHPVSGASPSLSSSSAEDKSPCTSPQHPGASKAGGVSACRRPRSPRRANMPKMALPKPSAAAGAREDATMARSLASEQKRRGERDTRAVKTTANKKKRKADSMMEDAMFTRLLEKERAFFSAEARIKDRSRRLQLGE